MTSFKLKLLGTALLVTLPIVGPAHAQSVPQTASDLVQVELLTGWRAQNGTHIAGIRIILAEGWKTYWRAPGDGGLPTSLEWKHSKNVEKVQMHWPRPEVFKSGGMRSIGYLNELTIPIELTPSDSGNIDFNARLHFGICREVCVPAVVNFRDVMTEQMQTTDASISAALSALPLSAAQAGIDQATCALETTANGTRLKVHVEATLEGQEPAMVIEHAEKDIWIGTTKLNQHDAKWYGSSPIYDGRIEAGDIAFEDVRITLLTRDGAIDIRGCSAS